MASFFACVDTSAQETVLMTPTSATQKHKGGYTTATQDCDESLETYDTLDLEDIYKKQTEGDGTQSPPPTDKLPSTPKTSFVSGNNNSNKGSKNNKPTRTIRIEKTESTEFVSQVNQSAPRGIMMNKVSFRNRSDGAGSGSVRGGSSYQLDHLTFADVEVMHHLQTQTELQFHEHRLATQYFRHRYTWLSLIPGMIFAFAASVLTLITETIMEEGDDQRQLAYILIGSFAALSVLCQASASYNKFGSRADMHQQVTLQLEELQNNMTRRAIGATFGETARLDLVKFDARVQEAIKGCASAVPISIANQFELLATRVALKMRMEDGGKGGDMSVARNYHKMMSAKSRELGDKINRSFVFPWSVWSYVDSVVKCENQWAACDIESATVIYQADDGSNSDNDETYREI